MRAEVTKQSEGFVRLKKGRSYKLLTITMTVRDPSPETLEAIDRVLGQDCDVEFAPVQGELLGNGEHQRPTAHA